MKWKILLFAFFLVATVAAISVVATPIFAASSDSSIDSSVFPLLDEGFAPLGDGDPLPGGGIPT